MLKTEEAKTNWIFQLRFFLLSLEKQNSINPRRGKATRNDHHSDGLGNCIDCWPHQLMVFKFKFLDQPNQWVQASTIIWHRFMNSERSFIKLLSSIECRNGETLDLLETSNGPRPYHGKNATDRQCLISIYSLGTLKTGNGHNSPPTRAPTIIVSIRRRGGNGILWLIHSGPIDSSGRSFHWNSFTHFCQ